VDLDHEGCTTNYDVRIAAARVQEAGQFVVTRLTSTRHSTTVRRREEQAYAGILGAPGGAAPSASNF